MNFNFWSRDRCHSSEIFVTVFLCFTAGECHRSVNIKNYNSKIQDFVSLVYTAGGGGGEGGVAIEQTLFHFEIP